MYQIMYFEKNKRWGPVTEPQAIMESSFYSEVSKASMLLYRYFGKHYSFYITEKELPIMDRAEGSPTP